MTSVIIEDNDIAVIATRLVSSARNNVKLVVHFDNKHSEDWLCSLLIEVARQISENIHDEMPYFNEFIIISESKMKIAGKQFPNLKTFVESASCKINGKTTGILLSFGRLDSTLLQNNLSSYICFSVIDDENLMIDENQLIPSNLFDSTDRNVLISSH